MGHTYDYGYSGNALTSIADPLTAATQFGYTSGRLTTVTDPRGTVTTITYDTQARVQSISTAGTRVALFGYSAGAATFTDANNHTTSYSLNSTGQATAVVDPLNGMTRYAYDANYNITRTTDPLGHVTWAMFDTRGNRLTYTDALNHPTTYTYNGTNDLLTVTDPLGRVSQYAYDSSGNLTSFTDAAGDVSTYAYDSHGQRTSATDAAGNTTAYAYSADGYQVVVTDALQSHTNCTDDHMSYFTYDASGRRSDRYWQFAPGEKCQTYVDNPSLLPGHRHSSYTYDGNRLISENAAGYYTRTLTYDSDGNVTRMQKGFNGHTYTLDYGWESGTHHMTSVTRTTDGGVNYWATLKYDRSSRITRLCQPNGCTNYFYVGDSDWLSFTTNDDGTVLQRYYYANGRPLRMDSIGVSAQYYRYNWHGDATRVWQNGGSPSGWSLLGAWGDLDYYTTAQGNYSWNAAYGYFKAPLAFNFDLNDGLDMGLWYVHGRWYNQDTGLFLSPDDKGEYFYGSGHW
ncbi:MAG: hypothetical protein M1482_10905 [Chloroflexi bacterium]|nr:hypothetical protein [Chloroflexota bacterium]